MATPTFSFTKGDTLNLECVYTQSSPSAPANLDGYALYSSFRDARGYIHTLTVTIVNPTHFTIFFANTEDWYPGYGFMDILFVLNGVAVHSETINAQVLNNVTPNTYT